MKQINLNKKINWKAGLIILSLLLALIILGISIRAASAFFDNNRLVFNQVLEVKVSSPISILKREPIKIVEILDYPGEVTTPIEKYICDTFGLLNCRLALAVAKAEGLNHEPDEFNLNPNNTIDVGFFRINSVHFKQDGCSLAEVITPKGNVDCAYKIWKEQGWSPWVSYKNGSYLAHIN